MKLTKLGCVRIGERVRFVDGDGNKVIGFVISPLSVHSKRDVRLDSGQVKHNFPGSYACEIIGVAAQQIAAPDNLQRSKSNQSETQSAL